MTWVDDVAVELEVYAQDVAAGVYSDEAMVTAPTGLLGWGADLVCRSDLTPDCAERSGDDPEVVIEAIFRRINTGRGQLPEDDDPETASYGIGEYGVAGWLNAGFASRDWSMRASELQSEITKDDRVEAVRVSISSTLSGASESITISIDGSIRAEDLTKPFSLTLSVTSAGVLVEALTV